jgi:hypothetical protein
VAAALLLFGLAACGGDDSGDGGSAAVKEASSTSSAGDADSSSPVAAGDRSGTSATTDTTEPDVSGIDKDDDFCDGWLDAAKAFDSDSFDPAELDDMLPVLRDLSGKAPDELKGDMKLLTDAFSQALPVLQKMTQLQDELAKDPSKAATMSAELSELNKQVEVFSTKEFEDASARISAYAEQKCGAKAD